jgi:hypothetical protein
MYRVHRINPFYCSKDLTHDVFGVLYIFTHFHIMVDKHYTVPSSARSFYGFGSIQSSYNICFPYLINALQCNLKVLSKEK